MDHAKTQSYLERIWDSSIVPELTEYIRIPNKSVAFDPEWQAHGHMDKVVARFEKWAREHVPKGATVEVVRLPKRTPLLFIEIPGQGPNSENDCILLYGHMDKQPEMAGWRAGLDAWTPKLEGDRLYGRGAADDGYAMFACLSAIGALEEQGLPHARCVVIIEACEESGSFDLPPYIEHLAKRIGQPTLVIALDSGCGNYEQMWCTTSLRGLVGGTLKVEVVTEGLHSGMSGMVPDSFRLARQLLSRVEDEVTGRVIPEVFHVEIPKARLKQAAATAAILGAEVYKELPFAGGTRPISTDPTEMLLNSTWRPALTIIGADGLPAADNAGNVLRPMTALKLSLRIPPTCDAKIASRALTELMEDDPPSGAKVSFDANWGATGWDAPELASWLEKSLDDSSNAFFGKPIAFAGVGGTIPFVAMLGERFPNAQFLITGVLRPHANAHGPNEFLHLPTGKRLTSCVAKVIADHARRT